MKKTIFAFCLVALLGAPSAMAQADFGMYVALGDSYTAGFASGSLMDWYQERSFPAVIAQQETGTTFEQPLMSQPGVGPILELVSLAPVPVIAPVGLIPGLPTNATLPRPYNNYGIPTATLYDILFRTGDILNISPDNAMFDLILRNGINTALEWTIGAQPTFMTVWIGNWDVLGALLAATPIDGVTMTPEESFALLFNNAIGALVTTTAADIVLINIPYCTQTPFATSLDPYVDLPELGRWYFMADTGPLTDDDLLTAGAGALIALGYGLPVPGSPPLPDNLNLVTGDAGVVLRAAEVEMINARIDAYNAIIADVGNTYGLPVFDMNALFEDLFTGAFVPTYGAVTLSTDFLLGGIYSYDGLHPQNIGYALIADELIQFINATYGNDIPRVDMGEVLFEGDWQSPGVSPAKAKEVVMSKEAFDQLYRLAPPKLDQAPRIRRPGGTSSDRPRGDIRRKPTVH
jgi:hypothetical protein